MLHLYRFGKLHSCRFVIGVYVRLTDRVTWDYLTSKISSKMLRIRFLAE